MRADGAACERLAATSGHPHNQAVLTELDRPWTRRPSRFARALCLVYLTLVVAVSLSPWSGWRDIGVSPLAYLDAPMPRYWTAFDLMVNALAYLPLGALFALALYPLLRGGPAAVAAALGAIAVSATMEALQTFLPGRISSQLDLAANGLGALFGAALGARYAPSLIDRGRLMQLRAHWFARDASLPLALLALWPLAQVHLNASLLANGDFREGVATVLRWLGWLPPWLNAGMFGPDEFVLSDAAIAMAGVLAAGLSFASIMRAPAPRTPLLLGLVAAALAAQAIAYGVQFGPERAFVWMTPGAMGGLVLGLLALLVAATGRPRAMVVLALVALLASIAIVNLTLANPYHANWMQQFHPGRFIHAATVAEWLSAAWPFALLLWLVSAVFARRERQT